MKTENFTVEKLYSTRSGNYAVYRTKAGVETHTHDFGYSVGDKVEIFDYDGYAPSKIIVNGKQVWDEQDRRNWWLGYDPQSQYNPNHTLSRHGWGGGHRHRCNK